MTGRWPRPIVGRHPTREESDEVAPNIQALLDGDRAARERAALALRGRRFDPRRLVPVLAHPHVSRQVKAIEVLRYVRTREAVELLVPMLASEHALVRRKTASSLGKIGNAGLDAIVAALETASTPWHRLAICDVLGRFGHPRGREVLAVQADAWDAGHRAHAIWYLRRYRADLPADVIVRGLADPETRETAIEVAGKLRDPSFLAPLIEVWLGDEPWPPRAAMHAIGKYGRAAVAPLLARAHAPALHRRIAAALYWCLWGLEPRAEFWTLWERPEPAMRDACLEWLGGGPARALSGPRRRAALAAHVQDPDKRRRLHVVAGYGQLARLPGADGDAALAALEVLASDPDRDVTGQAEATLRSLAGQPRLDR